MEMEQLTAMYERAVGTTELTKEHHLSEQLLAKVIENVSLGIWAADRDFKVQLWNVGQEIMTGIIREEIVGRNILADFPGLVDSHVEKSLRQVLGEGKSINLIEYPLPDLKSGEVVKYFNILANPFRDSRGEVSGIIVVVEDMTERKQVHLALAKSVARYRSLVENAPYHITVIDLEGRVLLTGKNLMQVSGDRVIGSSLYDYIQPEHRSIVRETFERVLRTRQPDTYELTGKSHDGQGWWYSAKVVPFIENGQTIGFTIFGKDITDLKSAELGLIESENKFRSLFQQSRDGIWLYDDAGKIIEWNDAIEQITGLKRPYALGRPLWDVQIQLLPPEERHAVLHDTLKAETLDFIRANHPINQRVFSELKTQHLDGSQRIMQITSFLIQTDKGFIGCGIVRDITEARHAFEEIKINHEQLRQLNHKVVVAQELERQRLSRELHDEAGQALTVLKIMLERIRVELPGVSVDLQGQIGDAIDLTDSTLERLRQIAQDLRPPALDMVGLSPTMENYCRHFAIRSHLVVHFASTELPELSDTVNICLYRVLQEALTNVAKHAEAKQIWVSLHYEGQRIRLSVEDDGHGFLSEPDGEHNKGIGLLGMQERVELVGGSLEIVPREQQGTRLVAVVPWKA